MPGGPEISRTWPHGSPPSKSLSRGAQEDSNLLEDVEVIKLAADWPNRGVAGLGFWMAVKMS